MSHLQGCIESAKVCDLLEAKKLVRLQRRYRDRGLSFESSLQDPIIVAYHDASWDTRLDLSSQGGQLTVLMEGRVLKGHQGKFSLNWTSRRLKRVARSSTSAEVQMCGSALDTHEFLKLAYLDMQGSRVLDLQDVDPYLQEIPWILVCDSKNVYDGLAKVKSTGLHMEEKRTAIELLGIKARLIPANISIRWVDGDQELADCLTKPWVYDQSLRALDLGSWKIVFDSEMLSAKNKRQLQKALKSGKSETLEGSLSVLQFAGKIDWLAVKIHCCVNMLPALHPVSVEIPQSFVVLPRFAPTPKTITLLATPPPSMDFEDLFWVLLGSNCRSSYPSYKPCISSKVVVGQSVIQPQAPCRTWVHIQAGS